MIIYRYRACQWVSSVPVLLLEPYRKDDFHQMETMLLFEAPKHLSKAVTAVDSQFSFSLRHEQIERFLPKEKQLETETDSSLAFMSSLPEDWRLYIKSALNLKWFKENDLESLLKSFPVSNGKTKRHKKYHVTLMGLGDVGSTLAMGLKLLGGECIASLKIWDMNPKQAKRWEIELNQILSNPEIKVTCIEKEALFDGDVFLFCASKGVPPVGERVEDVRMMQLAANAELLSEYVKLAADKAFKGLFCIISDPVDLLCKVAFETNLSHCGGVLKPEQIRGYGLGVMFARAVYYGGEAFKHGRVFGPHGKDLVVANAIDRYDDVLSQKLTKQVVNANLAVRDLGYKPYVAPALSSGAYSIINTLMGEWHESAVFLGGHYFGCRNRLTSYGTEIETVYPDRLLYHRMATAYERLGVLWEVFNS